MLGIFGQLSGGQKAVGAVVGTVLLLLIGAGVVFVYPTASDQGYAPEQPIPFSHKLHAGKNKIDCRYCHVGVTESKHATVPSVNICMNCHRAVKTDSPLIKKIHEAYNSGRPIEWVRVHRLPEHAKFNHKAHVLKGVDCKACHGDVRNMERVSQVGALTMGWCLQCHRGLSVPSNVLSAVKPGADPHDPGPLAPTTCNTCHQ